MSQCHGLLVRTQYTFTYEDARVSRNTIASKLQLAAPIHDALALGGAQDMVEPDKPPRYTARIGTCPTCAPLFNFNIQAPSGAYLLKI